MRLALFLLAAVTLSGIFDHELWTPDEPRDAEIAREMADGGSWAVPTLNRAPHLEKPPLFFWTAAAAMKLLGARAWAARVPSVLFSWGTLLFTFLLARRMFGRDAAIRACLLLATTWVFFLITHKCTVDDALLFFVTGTMYWLHRGFVSERKIGFYLVAYVFALGAFLSKGLVGCGLAGAGFLVFLVWNRSAREILRAQPWFAVLIVGLGAAAWLASLPADLRRTVLVVNNLGRFTGGYEGGHQQPFYYYLGAFWYALAPWSVLILFAIPWLRREGNESTRFLLSWLLAGVAALSVAATKREIYLLPMAPALAILVAGWIGKLGRAALLRAPAVAACVVAAAATIAMPIVDRSKTMVPFCRQLPPLEVVPVYDPDETTKAVIPFYTGRYVRPIATMEEAAKAAETKPAFLVVVDKRGRDGAWEPFKPWYPHVWFVEGKSRRMALLSNVPRSTFYVPR